MTIPETGSAARFALFASGAAFSCAVLESLRDGDCLPALVVLPEYPPAPAGNDLLRAERSGAFFDRATDLELAYAPRERQMHCIGQLRQREIDYLLVACWPYLIGPELRQAARIAALNLHPSLLPRYRGANPIAAQIGAAERRFGVTLHLLGDRFDHGDIVAQAGFEADPAKTGAEQIEKTCAQLGAGLFVDALRAGRSAWQCHPQAEY